MIIVILCYVVGYNKMGICYGLVGIIRSFFLWWIFLDSRVENFDFDILDFGYNLFSLSKSFDMNVWIFDLILLD